MKKLYEAWQYADGGIIAFGEAKAIRKEMAQEKDAKLLHQVEAEYWEEAQTLHYLKMDWGEYNPDCEAKECSNGCGALFYPEGSGECRNCGQIC